MPKVSKAKAADHRAAIVRVASRLFRARGVRAVGVAEITREAGLTHGGFYGHFASKEALAAEAIAAAFADGRARLEAHGVAGHLRGYLSRFHRDHPDEGCPILAFAGSGGRADEGVEAALGEGAAALIDAIADRLPAAIAAPSARRAEAMRLLALAVGAQVLARALAAREPALSEAVLVAARADALGVVAPGEAAAAPAQGASAKG